MWIFIKSEWKYWLRAPMTWIFFVIIGLLVFGAVSSENISIGGGVGSVHKNAPYVIQQYYGIMSLLCLLMTTAFMNATAIRDFQHDTYQLVFSAPIKKWDYFFGKFIGAYAMCIIPFLGVSVGALLGPLMPWAQPERYGPVIWDGHVMGLLSFALPNIFISGVLLFALAIIFRSSLVSFIGSIGILVFYLVSGIFTSDIKNEWLANILDPFGFKPLGVLSKYTTVDEKNLHAVPLSGAFLTNRLVWIGIALAILLVMYTRFSFQPQAKKGARSAKRIKEPAYNPTNNVYQPDAANQLSLPLLLSLIWFELKSVIKHPTFIIISVLGATNLVASLTSFTGRYGESLYPVTYSVIGSIRGAFSIFVIAIITFYTGVLVWKERDAKINEIQDATPIKTGLLFTSKLVAMILTVAIILLMTIAIGVTAQTCFGYHRYQLGMYFTALLGTDLLSFAHLIVLALFFHYLINNRYIAYFAFIAFVIVNDFIWGVLQISTNMVNYGSVPSIVLSDMNGVGPFGKSAFWYSVYWSLFALLLTFLVYAFFVRGKELGIRQRMQGALVRLKRNGLAVVAVLVLFLTCSGFVYYNTKVLNTYTTEKEAELRMVDYEKQYKKYEGLPQPRFYKLDYFLDLYPQERSLTVKIVAWARNKSQLPIKTLYLNMPELTDDVNVAIANSRLTLNDKRCKFRIMELGTPLQPGDSLKVEVSFKKLQKGFENQVSFTELTQNGSFFNNRDIMPSLGYSRDGEMADKNKRIKYKLPVRMKEPKLNEADLAARANTYISGDADWVDVSTTVSTSADQIAVAPGSLVREWQADGRRYFHYQLDKSSLNFFSFISARYQVARKKHNGVDIEVYYTKEHAYNVPNMLASAEKSLDYYIKNFGPYYHKQCRILEFPRYASFAQSFPGTMPYSEGIGFITDLRDVKGDDIDFVYYVVAHEIGHQYWAHQLCGAYMQGSEMMSEGFAQYSALMVMEKEYGKEKMKKFLKYEMDGYLRGRSGEFEAERPLIKTEQQGYIHYQKASVVLYYLKEMIGEDKMNAAMRTLLDTFAYKNPPYATSMSALRAFKQVTPDSLQYLIDDMLENITVFSNRVTAAKAKKVGNEYEVTVTTLSEKFRCDSLGKETARPLNDYIDVGLFAEGSKKNELGKPLLLQRLRVTRRNNSFTFRTKVKPAKAGIDPYNYLIDRIPDDNLKAID